MYEKKIIKKLEDSKMPQEFYTLLDFNFIMIYIIHEILILLKNHLHYNRDSIFKRFFKEYNKLSLFLKKSFLFTIYKDKKFRV